MKTALIVFILSLSRITFRNSSHSEFVSVVTPRQSAACGYLGFEVGERFIVFGHNESHTLPHISGLNNQLEFHPNLVWTNHCTSTSVYYDSMFEELEEIAASLEEE